MIYGVFSDVHGNYEALKSALAFFKKNKAASFICCGDLVGYGPQPAECVKAVMGLENLAIVLGNHDAAATGRMDMKWFNGNAIAAILYARCNLSGAELAWLTGLPETVKTPEFTLVHGSPRKPLTEYVLSESQFLENLPYWDISPCFIGHSHMPVYFRQTDDAPPETDFLRPMSRMLLGGLRYVLNPGSVGQPRDGNPRASLGLYDSQKKSFEIFRVDYNVTKTQELMKKTGLPQVLVDRLAYGL
ncbi:MAG: metallophosphoesterase family protein [Elusimicrobia bacterium]|nr:metallophosphoesterase family protein [Elusimicrobiota bacterium]